MSQGNSDQFVTAVAWVCAILGGLVGGSVDGADAGTLFGGAVAGGIAGMLLGKAIDVAVRVLIVCLGALISVTRILYFFGAFS